MKKILLSLFLFLLGGGAFAETSGPFPPEQQCVLIYYDHTNDPDYNLGEVYADYLQNLLGHFPELTQIVSAVSHYEKGEMEKCRSTLYLGSYFNNTVPDAFLSDFKSTEKNVAWLGYNIWKYSQEDLVEMFAHSYESLTELDFENLNELGNPSFYRFVDYKGERFSKFAKWVDREGEQVFAAPFELVALKKQESDTAVEVLATSVHDQSGEALPYALRSENRFYIADIPFSYVHESDRYLVFADLLFDILDMPPRHNKRKAVMRIEDVHPLTPVAQLMRLEDVFNDMDIPLHIALIPLFYDPLYRFDRKPDQAFLPMDKVPSFMTWLKRIQEDDAVFIWHGVTHQYKEMRNPHSGYSSDDFEFWDAVNNTKIKEDSVNYVLDRLELGMSYLTDAQIQPRVWLTPHYQASALDYYIFADVFDWNIGRAIYFLNDVKGLDHSRSQNNEIRFDSQNGGNPDARRDRFAQLEVEVNSEWFGQLYPYEIFGDVYGQRMIPEILGNPQPFTSDHVWYPRSLENIIEDARRNRVIRDSWASLFFHPYILTDLYDGGVGQYPGDTRPLIRLLKEVKNLGYEFVSLDEFAKENEKVENVKRFKLNPDGSWENKR